MVTMAKVCFFIDYSADKYGWQIYLFQILFQKTNNIQNMCTFAHFLLKICWRIIQKNFVKTWK